MKSSAVSHLRFDARHSTAVSVRWLSTSEGRRPPIVG